MPLLLVQGYFPVYRRVGQNPYGEWVEESSSGRRRVCTATGWHLEPLSTSSSSAPGALHPFRFCRLGTSADYQLCLVSLLDSDILASFPGGVSTAYRVWSAPSPSSPGLAISPPQFLAALQAELIRQTVSRTRRGVSPPLPHLWPSTLALSLTPGVSLGLWYGLGQRVLAEFSAHPAHYVELGLSSPAPAVTAWLPPAYSTLFTLAPSASRSAISPPDPYLPVSTSLSVWPLPAQSAFKKTAHLPPFARAVLWVLPDSSWSPALLQAWAAWLATGAGWVIFSAAPALASLERAFGASLLAATQDSVSRLTLTDNSGHPLYHLWSRPPVPSTRSSPVFSSQTLVAFAGSLPAPALLPPPASSTASPLQGSEPYLSPSPYPPTAFASPALNQAMYQATAPLWSASPSPAFSSLLATLGATPDTVPQLLNAEQLDAVLLALHNLTTQRGFILADETGLGKGRILAALARLGLAAGHSIVFLTENPSLFSDFYRDLLAVSAFTAVPPPVLLHPQASLYDPDGNLVAKSSSASLGRLLAQPVPAAPQLIFSTYAQLSRPPSGSSGSDKLAWLQANLDSQAWLLLDEAHNASGQSQTSATLKKLTTRYPATVFSSATFAKTELNLDLYSSLFGFDALTRKLFFQSIQTSPALLRESLTIFMAAQGNFVRRQHSPPPPPHLLWVPLDPAFTHALATFEQLWSHLFRLAGLLAPLANAEQLFTYLGGLLSRSTREFTLLAKLPTLLSFLHDRLARHQKIVVTLEGTLEASLTDYFARLPVSSSRLSPTLPLWREALSHEVTSLFSPEVIADSRLAPAIATQVSSHYQAVLQALAALPDWPLSPLDYLRDALATAHHRSGELSGRHSQLLATPRGFELATRDSRPSQRQAVVNEFNNQPLDVLFLTRAGCAGISLHAGKHFRDQRPRLLVELDIPLNPANRLQFTGRVRRKDQVVEPEFWGITIDTPLERRRFEHEANKQRKLQAHLDSAQRPVLPDPHGLPGPSPSYSISSSPVSASVSGNPANSPSPSAPSLAWLTPAGERLTVAWGRLFPASARLLGLTPAPAADLANVNRALSHCFVLSPAGQQSLLAFLDTGLRLTQDWDALAQGSLYHLPSRRLRSCWWFGDPRYQPPRSQGSLGVPRVELVERIWPGSPPTDPATLRALFTTAVQSPHQGPWLRQQLQAHATTFPAPHFTWLTQYLPHLTTGQGFTFSHPATGQPLRAVFLSLAPPVFSSASSLTDLSQFAGYFLVPGEQAPWLIPLDRLQMDPHFSSLGLSTSAWFTLPPVPHVELVLEGNLALASALGARLGIGQAVMLLDALAGSLPAWGLPGCTFEEFSSSPRDLLDVEQAFSFWRQFPQTPLTTALPTTQAWQAIPVQGGINFIWPASVYQTVQDVYLPFPIQKKLSQPRFVDRQVIRHVSWTYARSLLFAWDKLGVAWRVPSAHLDWYRQSSLAHFTGTKSRPRK